MEGVPALTKNLYLAGGFFNHLGADPDLFGKGQGREITVGAAGQDIVSGRNLTADLFSDGGVINGLVIVKAGYQCNKGQ